MHKRLFPAVPAASFMQVSQKQDGPFPSELVNMLDHPSIEAWVVTTCGRDTCSRVNFVLALALHFYSPLGHSDGKVGV